MGRPGRGGTAREEGRLLETRITIFKGTGLRGSYSRKEKDLKKLICPREGAAL